MNERADNTNWRKSKKLYFLPIYGANSGVDFQLTGSKKNGYKVHCGGWYDGFAGISCEFTEQDRLDLIEMLQMANNSEEKPFTYNADAPLKLA